MKIDEYITSLRKDKNIIIAFENGEVKIKATKGTLTKEIIEEIKGKKSEILEFFKSVSENNKYVAIPKAEKKEYYQLSSAQKRLFFLYEFNNSSLAYNIPSIFNVDGELNKEKFTIVFKKLISRHESLRTSFEVINGEPVQKISEQFDFEIESYQLSEKKIQEIFKKFIKPFTLKNAPLIRVGLIQISLLEHILMIDMHHIITDGISRGILIKEFMSLYNNEQLPELELRYKDYAESQQGAEHQEEVERQRKFWLNEFFEPPPILELPTDFARPSIKTHKGNFEKFLINEEETVRLRSIAKSEEITMFSIILSIYNILLSKLSDHEDIVIGTSLAGRQHPDLDNIIGMFVNTVPLRNYPKGTYSFKEFLSEVKTRTLACLENQAYQYETLVDELKVERDTSRNPLFDIVFSFENIEEDELKIPGLILKPFENEQTVAQFDIALIAYETDNNISLRFDYSTELYKVETIKKIIEYFKKIVKTITTNIYINISDIDIISDRERCQILNEFNDTDFEYLKNESVISLFEKQANKTPDDIAIIYDNEKISYSQLNSYANEIACEINKKVSSGKNEKVCLLFNPSIELVASMLGALKAGFSFVPLSLGVSAQRNKFIFTDCEAKVLLVQESLINTIPSIGLDKIIIIEEKASSFKEIKYLSKKVSAEDSIYVIYTSGTTGNPKGVDVKNLGIVNMLHFYKYLFNVKEGMRMSQVANICFDASAFEIWPSLVHGGCLHIAPRHLRHDPELMRAWLIENKIEITYQPTAIAEYLLKRKWNTNESSLKIINVAGEKFNYVPTEILPFKLFNLYGPTEDSIWTTWAEVKYNKANAKYSIGTPISNKKIFILNKYNKMQPIGVPGELCISGDGLARGYINNEKLTNEKFIDNPFIKGEKVYKTGDLARWMSNGDIEFLGRIDNQVKIRGNRVELEEIKNQLLKHKLINEVVVIAVEREEDKYLVTYFTSDERLQIYLLKEYLKANLPDYMIPSYFVQIERIPLTPNGKLNKKALPLPEVSVGDNFVAASNDIEKKLVKIWSEVLKIDKTKISIHSNYFDLGGNSINIIKLNRMINDEFKCTISVANMFRLSTIKSIADYLTKGDQEVEKIKDSIDEAFAEANDFLNILEDRNN